MIHKILLVVGTVYPARSSESEPFKSPFKSYWDGSRRQIPDANWLSALRFCGELADGAERVLYRKNTIILDIYNFKDALGDRIFGCHGEHFEPSDRRKAYIKFVKVKLDSGCYRNDMWDDRSIADEAWEDATLDSQEKRLARIHELSIEALCESFWGLFLEQISELSLSSLELDLEDITCPIGCCRVTGEVAWDLDFSLTGMPEKIIIKRTLNQEETDRMINIIESRAFDLSSGDESDSEDGDVVDDNDKEEEGETDGDEDGKKDMESDGHGDEDEDADEVL